jgi:death-on-curing family protein
MSSAGFTVCGTKGRLESANRSTSERYFYGNGDLYEIAGAYAYHIAESQAFLDGNKRTAVRAALDFLEINGVDTSRPIGSLRSGRDSADY